MSSFMCWLHRCTHVKIIKYSKFIYFTTYKIRPQNVINMQNSMRTWNKIRMHLTGRRYFVQTQIMSPALNWNTELPNLFDTTWYQWKNSLLSLTVDRKETETHPQATFPCGFKHQQTPAAKYNTGDLLRLVTDPQQNLVGLGPALAVPPSQLPLRPHEGKEGHFTAFYFLNCNLCVSCSTKVGSVAFSVVCACSVIHEMEEN